MEVNCGAGGAGVVSVAGEVDVEDEAATSPARKLGILVFGGSGSGSGVLEGMVTR